MDTDRDFAKAGAYLRKATQLEIVEAAENYLRKAPLLVVSTLAISSVF